MPGAFISLLLLLLIAGQQAAQPGAPSKPPQTATTPLSQPMPRDSALPVARDAANKFLDGRGALLWDTMTAVMQRAVGNDRARWSEIAAGVPQQIGRVTETLNERMLPALDLQAYTRHIRTDRMPGTLAVSVALTSDGKIAGMAARPVGNPAETKFLDYKDRNSYRFPLAGEWTIYQGGRSVYDNYHAAYPDERFACDIIAFRGGSMYRDGGTSLEMFHGFGQAVLAAAAGKVVLAEDNYQDNALNRPSPSTPKQGNSIVIDHGHGEFSMYAHLKSGSVKVKAGDTVKPGQRIAEVGNSGNSPIPHLHFHLQNSPVWFQGEGLPVFFHDVTVDGKQRQEFEPVRGNVVEAGSPPAG